MKKLINFLLAAFFIVVYTPAKSQTSISGVINKYAKVLSYDNVLKDRVKVDIPTNFNEEDTVLLIQMKGATILDTTSTDGFLNINSTGKYEFIQVSAVNNTTGWVVFSNKVLNNYNNGEAIQLVRVPGYASAKVTGKLTCSPWDGEKGGILAFFANDTLEIKDTIDVSGKGFLGATPVQYTGTCSPGIRYYSNAVAGKKGESIVGSYFNKFYGKGFLANGGGGGNGRYAGGGGGGGVSKGSKGNRMTIACNDLGNLGGGEFGIGISDYFIGIDDEHKDHIFFGGGGGSGTYPVGATSAKGGNGGGIVFILAKTIKNYNSQYPIKANGESVTTVANNNAGTGGGGGGGTILLSAEKFSEKIIAEVKGGNGGSTDNYCSGQGGGGGGGFIWYTTPVSGGIDSAFFAEGGKKGNDKENSECVFSFQANEGYSLRSLNPVLNGFLYNLISANHTICYGNSSNTIKGSYPRGGNGVYTFLWQKRKWKTLAWTNIPGSNVQDYKASSLLDSTEFRRVVTTSRKNSSGETVVMSDSSKVVLVSVIPQILNNTVAPSYIEVCSGQPAPQLIGGVATRKGDPSPSYLWKTHKRGSAWVDAALPNTLKDFGQAVSTTSLSTSDTTYYHRIVSSLFCRDTVTATVVVHPKITSDSIWVDLGEWRKQEICTGATPKQILGSVPKGGKAGSFSYKWEKAFEASPLIWTKVDSSSTLKNYGPGALTQDVYYRRTYYSGMQGVCNSTTQPFKIKVWPQISGNSIQSLQPVICESTAPAPFTLNVGSITGGDGVYRYYWKRSTNGGSTWDSVQRAFTSNQYPNDIISTATSYKRVLGSGLYNCCLSESNVLTVDIQPKFRNHFISKDTTICSKQQPALLGPRSYPILYGGKKPYKYQWQQRIDNSKVWAVSVTDSVHQPSVLNDTSYFRRIVISADDICRDTASVLVRVLPSLKNNIITGDAELCNDSVMSPILASASLTGGSGQGGYKYIWQYKQAGGSWITTTATDSDYPKTKLESVDTARVTTFRRTVISGFRDCCVDSASKWDVKVFPRPISGGALRDTSLIFDFSFDLIAPSPKMGQGVWRAIGFDPMFNPASDSTKTRVNIKLPNPEQTYKIQWIISTSNVCPIKIDSFQISIKDIDRFNGFSPNGDQYNEYFVVKGLQNLLDNNDYWELKILNRWGGLVYSADINNDRLRSLNEIGKPKPLWDGKNQNGEYVSSDTYYYVLTILKKGDKSREYKGFVVMKR